ncbi:MAG TPA: sugar-binding protein [Vicinamibacterales bacterium]|nr:sugar-binding protein [Vicinamibacterales bacterium]
MKWKLSVLAMVMAGMLACGGGGTAEGPRKLRFALIPKALDIPVFNYADIGAKRAAAELGNVEVIYRGPDHADELKQKEILESFISQKVDGIAISVLNAAFLSSTIDKAIDAGIPVVTWDSDAPSSKRIAFYGVDDFKSGQIMGEEAAKLLNGKGTVAFLTSLGANNLQRRLDGAKEALAKYPGITIVETYDVKEDSVRAAELIATGTNRYPDLGAWISVGGWPVFTANALAPVPAHTKVISFDTNPPAPDLVKAGKAHVLLGQKYFGWGGESIKLLHQIVNGQRPPAPIIDSGVDIVTAANVDQYVAEWNTMMGK